ncbi:MAG: hypothetical protein ABW192_05380 [Sphingobium sp.]
MIETAMMPPGQVEKRPCPGGFLFDVAGCGDGVAGAAQQYSADDVDEAVLRADRVVVTNGPAAHIGEDRVVDIARPRNASKLSARPVMRRRVTR